MIMQWLFQYNTENSISREGYEKMTNRNNNRNQPHTGGSKAADTEFERDFLQIKKTRKHAAGEEKKKNS